MTSVLCCPTQLRIRLAFFVVLFASPCTWAGDADWLIVPGERVGKITPTSSESDLKKAYGDENVEEIEVSLGEGETEKGTVLFPKDPERRIQILWNDPRTKSNPVRIQIDDRRSRWKTAAGITIGTSLHELETINGKDFILTGFGWDYSGTVLSWNEGGLDKRSGPWGGITLRLDPEDYGSSEGLSDVLGDRDFPSSQASMQKLNPKVYQIVVEFTPKPGN